MCKCSAGDVSIFGQRNSQKLPPSTRIRVAHLLIDQQRPEVDMVQIRLQNRSRQVKNTLISS